FANEIPMADVRRLMETPTAHDSALWDKMVEQGYTGIIFPEDFDGVGLTPVELILLSEEAGRALLPGPFFSTVALAGSVLNECASDAQKKKYLAPICRGEARATLAMLESSPNWNLSSLGTAAAGGSITGEKLFVTDAAAADFILVVVRDGVHVVDAKAPGLT